jgi:hypothetical protein
MKINYFILSFLFGKQYIIYTAKSILTNKSLYIY